jgi:hypothetical protein
MSRESSNLSIESKKKEKKTHQKFINYKKKKTPDAIKSKFIYIFFFGKSLTECTQKYTRVLYKLKL